MKVFKKVISIILVGSMVLGLVACSGDRASEKSKSRKDKHHKEESIDDDEKETKKGNNTREDHINEIDNGDFLNENDPFKDVVLPANHPTSLREYKDALKSVGVSKNDINEFEFDDYSGLEAHVDYHTVARIVEYDNSDDGKEEFENNLDSIKKSFDNGDFEGRYVYKYNERDYGYIFFNIENGDNFSYGAYYFVDGFTVRVVTDKDKDKTKHQVNEIVSAFNLDSIK